MPRLKKLFKVRAGNSDELFTNKLAFFVILFLAQMASYQFVAEVDQIGIQYIDFTAEYDASLVELLKILGKVGESGIPPASKILKPSTKASTPKEKTRSRITPQQEEEVIWRKIVEIVVDNLGIDSNRVMKEASFVYDLGADDLDMVELVMKLEDKFNIEISDTVVDKLITVGDAYQYVLKKLNHKN